MSVRAGMAAGYVFILFVVDIDLEKLQGLLFGRIAFDVIAWTDHACRTRVSEKD